MTLDDFSKLFAGLALQLRQTDADEPMIRAYYKALSDIDGPLLEMAAERLSRTSQWFPKTSEWRELAFNIEHERSEELAQRLRESTARQCFVCDDTGWRIDSTTNRAQRCECAKLRRLEILGVRPMPSKRLTVGSE